jgi:hypothetical protein
MRKRDSGKHIEDDGAVGIVDDHVTAVVPANCIFRRGRKTAAYARRNRLVVIVIAIRLVAIVAAIMTIVVAVIIVAMFRL